MLFFLLLAMAVFYLRREDGLGSNWIGLVFVTENKGGVM